MLFNFQSILPTDSGDEPNFITFYSKNLRGITMIKNNVLASIVTLFLLIPMAFMGCSGGGGSDETTESTGTPSIQALPATYNFGTVTDGNAPAPLEVEITNSGTAGLNVSSMVLLDTDNFALNLSGGSQPCNSGSPTIAAEGNCTVEVEFDPPPGSPGSFLTNLRIRSNDSTNAILDLPLVGSQEAVDTLNVRINQIEACPRPGVVTAYVSVTDQGGYPVTGLSEANFEIFENNISKGQPMNASFVGMTGTTVSVVLVMDYSGSITDVEDAADDMEESAAGFIDQLGAGDEAEIIKFADNVDVVQKFTLGSSAGKVLLKDTIYAPYDNGEGETDLYDAVVKAVDNIVDFASKDRKAVIVITDGKNDAFLSDNPDLYSDVIDHAKNNGVPIFAVGLGSIDLSILQDMANLSGGQVYKSTTSDNLRTIYQQLADLLYYDQYILTYTSGLGDGETAELKVEATSGDLTGNQNNTKQIAPCP
jgi:Ca-activated chloride channel family protein